MSMTLSQPAELRKQSAKIVAFEREILEMRSVIEQLDKKVEALSQPRQNREPLPFYARVRVVGKDGIAAEVSGKKGTILGREQSNSGEWLYAVMIDRIDEAYCLPHFSLEFTGETIGKSDIHSGQNVRVRVDRSGNGRVSKRSSRSTYH
jgi:Immunity protein 31